MEIEIIAIGHNTEGTSDKVWGAGFAKNPDGTQTGFRFWGAREKPLTFKVCHGDFNRFSLESKWRDKERAGYDPLPDFSLSSIRVHLGEKCHENVNRMITSAMLLGVSDEAQTTA